MFIRILRKDVHKTSVNEAVASRSACFCMPAQFDKTVRIQNGMYSFF